MAMSAAKSLHAANAALEITWTEIFLIDIGCARLYT